MSLAFLSRGPGQSRYARRLLESEVDSLVGRWRAACVGAGACQLVHTASGVTEVVPRLVDVTVGPPTTLIAQLPAGMLADDLRRLAFRLAPHLGAAALRVEPRGLEYVCIKLLPSDPLAEVFPLVERGGTSGQAAPRSLFIGRGEDGVELLVDPVDLPHLICQGQTRSGKSTWLYSLIAQFGNATHASRLIVAGVDPSGLLLRPFAGTRHEPWQASGLADLDHIERTVAHLVAAMDERLVRMPVDRDVLPVDADSPLVIVVFDEFPALLRALDGEDAKRGKRVRAGVARLLAESHKVGIRVILAAQRAEAAVVGAAERAQCAGRLSFRVDSPDSVKLLHADADEYVAAHTSAPPGIAICSWPGRPTTRIRAPYIDYATYARVVAR